MSFREKTAWISLAATLVVWGLYFSGLWREISGGAPSVEALTGLFVRSVVLTVVIEVVLAVVLAVTSPRAADAPADERERLIELKATRAAYWVLCFGAFSVVLLSPWAEGLSPRFLPEPADNLVLVLANGLLLVLILAELARSGAQVIGFRRGA